MIELVNGEDKPITTGIDFSEFSYSWTCFIVMGIVFLLTLKKNLGIFVKLNTYGVIAVCVVIIFICGVGIYSLTNTKYVFTVGGPIHPVPAESGESNIEMFKKGFGHLMGILGGGYYLHNISLTIVKNNRH